MSPTSYQTALPRNRGLSIGHRPKASISAPAQVRTAAGAPFAARSNYLKAGSKAVSAVINRTGGIPIASGYHRNWGFEIVFEPFAHHPVRMARDSKPKSWPGGPQTVDRSAARFWRFSDVVGGEPPGVERPTVGGELLGGEGYQTPWQVEDRTSPPTGWRSRECIAEAVTE